MIGALFDNSSAMVPQESEDSPCGTGCPILEKEIVINARLDAVWDTWTTNNGLSIVSEKSNVELRVGGPYELFLNLPPDSRGVRGSEGSRILAYLPKQMLAFLWTFPPDIPSLRESGETTTVIVLFEELGENRVQVQLHELGWKEGRDWRNGWIYFDDRWQRIMERMKLKLEQQATASDQRRSLVTFSFIGEN